MLVRGENITNSSKSKNKQTNYMSRLFFLCQSHTFLIDMGQVAIPMDDELQYQSHEARNHVLQDSQGLNFYQCFVNQQQQFVANEFPVINSVRILVQLIHKRN